MSTEMNMDFIEKKEDISQSHRWNQTPYQQVENLTKLNYKVFLNNVLQSCGTLFFNIKYKVCIMLFEKNNVDLLL